MISDDEKLNEMYLQLKNNTYMHIRTLYKRHDKGRSIIYNMGKKTYKHQTQEIKKLLKTREE